jgi:hypothetical protein
MSSMKRVQLVLLVVVAAALLAATPALAARKKASGTARLTPPATSDEPEASGQAWFTGSWFEDHRMWYVYGDLTVTCTGLTPGATYRTTAGSFTASPTGEGTATIRGICPPSWISVAREEAQVDESVELIVVLEGTMSVH